jgi:predicted GIY-YIG superfamily endonuclease
MLKLNIVREPPSDHLCYVLKSDVADKIYIGYTIDFPRRLRQHNGEITGGAKYTKKWRPWKPVCIINGFYESSAALRFEYRLQHSGRKSSNEDIMTFTLKKLNNIIYSGDGSIAKNNKIPWPPLTITWFIENYKIDHPLVINKISSN